MVVLAIAGAPAGLIWLAVAPRRKYQVVEDGFQALEPQSEALIGADGWLMIVTGALGGLAGVLVWRLVRERGVGVLVGMTLGTALLSVVAWQFGEALGVGSSAAEQAQLGAIVTPPLQLRAISALLIGPFLATLTYLVMVSFVRRDDLHREQSPSSAPPLLSSGWTEPPAAPVGQVPPASRTELSAPGAADGTARPAEPSSGPRPAVPGDLRQ